MPATLTTPNNKSTNGAAVFAAYSWPHDLTDEQILERLLALNLAWAGKEG